MFLSDRIIRFSSRASALSRNGTETYEDEQTLAKEEYARTARELNVFLENFLESCSRILPKSAA